MTNNPAISYSPAWSPDGRYIAFCRGTDQKAGAIWMIFSAGWRGTQIVDLHATAVPDNRSLSWSPDSKWLIYADSATPDGSEVLFQIGLESGEKRQLTFPSSNSADLYPAFSPDGANDRLYAGYGPGNQQHLPASFSAGRTGRGSTSGANWTGFRDTYCARPAWTPDSKQIVFASNRPGDTIYGL